MPNGDKIDKTRLENFLDQYIQDTHIGTLEKYSLETIQKYQWFDKPCDEILVTYKVRYQTKAPTIGPPPIHFYTDTVVVTGYKIARTYSLDHQGHLNKSYPSWMG